MEINKLKTFQPSEESDCSSEGELILRSGDTVSRSGIYEVIHAQHDADATGSVIAIRGERVGPCQTCGDRVLLRLVYAAPHISEDSDFYPQQNPLT